MSNDSDDSDVVITSRKSNTRKRKRQRLLSEESNHNNDLTEELKAEDAESNHSLIIGSDDDSKDELIPTSQKTEKQSFNNAKHPIQIDSGDEEGADDDEDDSDLDAGDREDEAIIESLYDDEDGPKERLSSAASKRVQGLRQNVVNFFETASAVDLESIPGVSKKKVEQLLTLRPILSWEDLNRKIQAHRSAGINEDVVINAVKTIKSRTVVEKLMSDCHKLAQDIGQLVDKLPEAPQPKCIPPEMKLTSYQLIGLNWLALLHNRGINGILADEMGLGKTIQVIAFLGYLRERLNLHRHHLIIVPSSTLDNWEREFDTWCPEIKLLQYYGTQEYRAQIRHYVHKNTNEVDVVLTTYNIAQNPDDRKLFKRLGFEYIIFDEAHMLKNMKSGRYQGLIKIKSRRRILLTGTPLQNNLVELMSLLVFTMPRMMMSKINHVEALFSAASRDEGGKTQFERERIEQAKRIMKPFVLRRLKEDVLKQLPKKSEQTIFVPMSNNQKKLYKRLESSFKREIKDHLDVLNDDRSFAEDSSDDIKKGAGMLMAMRRMANHPLLAQNKYDKKKLTEMASLMLREPTHRDANKDLILEDMSVMHDYELHQLCKTYKSLSRFKLADDDILDSGKFQKMDELLNDLKSSKQRCLIFSQFTMMLDIMEEYMTIRGIEYLRLDGSTKVSDRLSLIDEFNQNDKVMVFLLSTKAGGLGINLTAANVVIIHDIDFNPYNDKQAEDRSHRLGQTKNVTVYKLITKDTVEEGMLDIAKEKLRLGKNMSENDVENGLPPAKDMRSLLRSSLKL